MNNKQNFILQDFFMQIQQLDYSEVMAILGAVIVAYSHDKTLSSFKLHREHKPKNIKKVVLPPELKQEYSELDMKKIFSSKYSSALFHFATILTKKFSQGDLINFYNNINALTLESSKQKLMLYNFFCNGTSVGYYSPKKNSITSNENYFDDVIYHELFHMASSICKDGIIYSGFNQISKFGNLGRGINEGYTELLTAQNFNGGISYEYLVGIASRLESIVGRKKMQSLYLNANLLGLVEELKQYCSEEEIMQFISDTDFICNHIYNKKGKNNLSEKKLIERSLKNINKFLIKIYAKKSLQKYEQGIHDRVLTAELGAKISTLPCSLHLKNHSYEIFTQEELKEYLFEILREQNESLDFENVSGIKK